MCCPVWRHLFIYAHCSRIVYVLCCVMSQGGFVLTAYERCPIELETKEFWMWNSSLWITLKSFYFRSCYPWRWNTPRFFKSLFPESVTVCDNSTLRDYFTLFGALTLVLWGVRPRTFVYRFLRGSLPFFSRLHSVSSQTAPNLQYRFLVVQFVVCKRWSQFPKFGREIVKKWWFSIHAMKAYRGSKGIAPPTLNVGGRWRWDVIMFPPLYPRLTFWRQN